MKQTLFISHCNGDENITELFSLTLRNITLGQITPWFTSDNSGVNGLTPGDIWFNKIISKIEKSKALIALLTPNSIDRQWIYFESGIGQALKDCKIIPVCIGVNRGDILPPLGLYQCYQLNDYRSVVDFFIKLLRLFDIEFNEEMSKTVIEKFVTNISKINFETQSMLNRTDDTIGKLVDNLKSHIDKRFIEIIEKSSYIFTENNRVTNNEKIKTNQLPEDIIYSVQFDIDFKDFKNNKLFVDIRSDDSFQSLTDKLYLLIREHVKPFSYLEKWIIIEQESNKHIVIREIASRIPAYFIFKPNSKWKIIKLTKPYVATESSSRIHGKDFTTNIIEQV